MDLPIGRRSLLLLAAIVSPFGAFAQGTNDWITVNKDYSSQRYVDLDQINTGNVSALKPVCEAQLNEPSWFSSGVLMVGRTLYVSTLRATYAVDAATCEVRWRDVIKLGPTANISNRGPGYLDGTIFRGTADGRVIALDAKTGKVLWDQKHADPAENESFVAAPIAWDGKVFIGIAISDTGIRGRLLALDAKTGKELWRFYTVPPFGPGQPKGGGFWTTFSLDSVTREVLAPAANPAPDFEPWVRPGPNVYTNSVVTLNASTGQLNWFYQHTPGDDHDWDLGSAPTLYRTRSGKNMVAVAGKDGWVVGLDRETRAQMFKTPGTTITNHGPLPDDLTLVCPGLGGGSQFNGAAYHPGTGALYVGEVDWCSYFVKPEAHAKLEKEGEEESSDMSTATEPQSNVMHKHPDAVFTDYATQPRGMITAIDGETGHILWKYPTDAQMLAGLVPTKGGLVFAGDVRGNLFAFDAKSGAVLKHIDVSGALNSGLISYAVDGTQYVAASVGGVTLNARGVSGPLAIKIYGLQGEDTPKITTFDRQSTQMSGAAASVELFSRMCAACHGSDGKGRTYASLTRMTQFGDPEVLKTFLANVPPPMPVLYPGLMNDDEVRMIAEHMKTFIKKDGPTTRYVAPKSGGTPEWQVIYSVMVSPRCINCHSVADYPRQTDDRYPHVYHVERGEDDKGIEMKRCTQCHGMRNDPVTGAPGRIDWHMAPVIKSTESSPGVPKIGPRLCADLKDKSKNGNRDFAQLLDFIETDPFIQWAWDPGVRSNGKMRTTPPTVTHDEFLGTVKKWIAEGAPCPTQ